MARPDCNRHDTNTTRSRPDLVNGHDTVRPDKENDTVDTARYDTDTEVDTVRFDPTRPDTEIF
ncbi:hypothetical protein RHMOL_Rhmol05G0141500 [Rhododendron molle]|uniref:Uncharacterized protein n=1 Tax=Rhododendron molle TaxID=49168 RepID=A0ACC0NNP3_RHOML|nr:hypothetical protein RHMOL_Rhmol05G0141500 [Rhododendron molle]